MKIIIVGTAHPYRGGLAAFNERLAREFVAQGHEVEIYTFTLQYPSCLFPGKTQYSDADAPKNLNIIRKINSVNPCNWLKVGREIGRKQADIVVFCYWMSFVAPAFGSIAKLAGRNQKTKCIGLLHNMLPHEPNILDRFLPKYFVKNIDAFVTLSKSVIDDINLFDKKNKPKVSSPHPVYDNYGEALPKTLARRSLNIEEDAKVVLFFGFIRHYKGLDLLIEAFGNQQIKDMNLKLLIAGEFYENPEIYHAKINDLNLENQIILYTDYIPDEKVKDFFSAADMVAQPYRTATQSGVSQIALYFEKPMIVTDVGGLSEIVLHRKTGYVVQPAPAAIADALIDFFKNGNTDIFLEEIKKEKEKYAWHHMTDTIKNLAER